MKVQGTWTWLLPVKLI
uniref:Uncharacterized protein n=1 Tax=Arundo donax TaxID=35708 RepID=A0A0A9G6U0_ARUDO